MSVKVGVVLSGCGVNDGSEIHEATLTLLHLVKGGAEVFMMAPDTQQAQVIDHITGEETPEEQRNVLVESARIARGPLLNVADIDVKVLDALVFPGGFGAAKNLSDFAFHQESVHNMVVEIHTSQMIKDMYAAGKPMGFICISPAAVAAVALRGEGIKITVGNDTDIATKIAELGNEHIEAAVDEIVVDDEKNIVSTPAYMLAKNIAEADNGIAKLVNEVIKRARASATPAVEDIAS